jgi:hypothetical protein
MGYEGFNWVQKWAGAGETKRKVDHWLRFFLVASSIVWLMAWLLVLYSFSEKDFEWRRSLGGFSP